jgi:vancomycin permeability regulator SanA
MRFAVYPGRETGRKIEQVSDIEVDSPSPEYLGDRAMLHGSSQQTDLLGDDVGQPA